MSVGLILSIGSLVIAIAAAWFARRSARAAEQRVEQQRLSRDLSALLSFISRDYLDRPFTAVQPPIIAGQECSSLRHAKWLAEKEIRQNHHRWDAQARFEKIGEWQNTVAFETAIALERLGAATFGGFIPLRMLLAIAGGTIIDDWIICRPWVESYRHSDRRSVSRITSMGSAEIHYERRHAEWLALVTAAWMCRHWSNTSAQQVVNWCGGIENVHDRIQTLSTAEGPLLTCDVRAELKDLVGVST